LPLYNAVLEAIGPELDTVLSTSYYGANKKLIKVPTFVNYYCVWSFQRWNVRAPHLKENGKAL